MTCERRQVPLKEVLEEFNDRLETNSEPIVLTLTEGKGFVPQADRFKKRLAVADTSNYKLIGLGDIAFNPYLLWAGAVAQNTAWTQAIISPLYPTFRPRQGVSSRYIWHMLRSPDALSAFDSISFGSVPRKRRAATRDFLETRVYVPSLPEQRRIAQILDQADDLRTKQLQALRLLDELEDSVFVETFEGASSWPCLRFEDVLALPLRNGISPSTAGLVKGRVLTLGAITHGKYDASASKDGMFERPHDDSKLVALGEMLICRGNGNQELVGRGELVDEDAADALAFPDTMIAARLDKRLVAGEYVRAAWSRPSVRAQIRAGARTTNGTFKVNQQTLNEITFPVPPLRAQHDFALRIERISALRRAILKTAGQVDELLASLQHRAFGGEL